MEMTPQVSSFIEQTITTYGTNNDICNSLIFIYHLGDCCCTTYGSKIVQISQYRNKIIYGLLLIIWRLIENVSSSV